MKKILLVFIYFMTLGSNTTAHERYDIAGLHERLRSEAVYWDIMTEDQQLQLLELVVQLEQQYLGIDCLELTLTPLDNDVEGGEYDGESTISVNIDHLQTFLECSIVLSHEVRHAYQRYLCEHIDWDDPITELPYYDRAWSWKRNFEDYKPVESGLTYSIQPIEVDAKNYMKERTIFYNTINERTLELKDKWKP